MQGTVAREADDAEVHPGGKGQRGADGGGPENHVGITRIAFEVDDTDAIYEKLRTRGNVDILGKPATVTSPTTGSLRILTFKDPHGIILVVIEHNPASD